MKRPFRCVQLLCVFIGAPAAVACSNEGSRSPPSAAQTKDADAATAGSLDAAPPVQPAAPAAGAFAMSLKPAGALTPGTEASVTIELRDSAGAQVTALDTMHDTPLHLVVVAPDLSSVAHAHAEREADGTLRAALTLPHPATYVAFANFRPTGAPQASARATLEVPGQAPAPKPLKASALPARTTIDGFEVRLRSKAPLVKETDAILELEIFEKGTAISDLQDHLGARGSCLLISEDTTQYLHTHPLGGTGSKVQFHTTLPAAGTYKLWAQFRPAGKPLLASFVVEVLAEAPHDHGGKGHDHGGKGHDHGGKGHGHAH